MKHILKLDAWVLAKVQDAYLWAFDWIGVYIGSLIFVCGAVGVLPSLREGHYVFPCIIMFLISIVAYIRYSLQHSGMYEAYNTHVMSFEESAGRRIFIAFNLILMIMPPYGFYVELGLMSNILGWYLLSVKIRKRDPKEFKFLKTAMQGSEA